MSIPLVVAGSQIMMKLIERLPWLVVAGGGLLGYIAGDIATHDTAVKPWIDARMPELHWIVPAAGIAVVVVAGMWLVRRRRPLGQTRRSRCRGRGSRRCARMPLHSRR